jgi:hypothetical protein
LLIACACTLLPADVAEPSTITSGWYQGVSATGQGSPQTIVTNGPASVEPQELSMFSMYQPFPAAPPSTLAANALLYGDATADTLHAFARSDASILTTGAFGNLSASGFSNFGFTVRDSWLFSSTEIAPGTPVDFELIATLHSTVAASSPGICSRPIGLGYAPTGQAQLVTTFVDGGFPQLYSPLIHDTCGRGADLMTATAQFTAALGEPLKIQTLFELFSSAGVFTNHDAGNSTTVDGRSTARLYVKVLTPGVTFSAASGASYALPTAVPEPGTLTLAMLGVFGVASLRRAL